MIVRLPACDFDTGPLNPADTFVDCDQAAELLDTTPSTLRGLVAELRVRPAAMDNGQPLFRVTELADIHRRLCSR